MERYSGVSRGSLEKENKIHQKWLLERALEKKVDKINMETENHLKLKPLSQKSEKELLIEILSLLKKRASSDWL